MNEYQYISCMDFVYNYTDNNNNNNNNNNNSNNSSSNRLYENLNNRISKNFDNNTQLLTISLPLSSSSSSSSSITINTNYRSSNSNNSNNNNNNNSNNVQQYPCNDGINFNDGLSSATNANIATAFTITSATTSASFTASNTTSIIPYELNIPYVVLEILVAICAIIGNLMVIIVFQRERKLRRRTNYYIVSLAMADFLVGSLGVPFAILASIGLPTNLYACLFTVSLLVVLCTISIFCLVAVSIDRYWAILYPMAYSRNVRTRTAIGIISMCWLAGLIVGFLPLFGWHAVLDEPQHGCLFVEVMDYSYLVFLNFATIITPAFLMLAFYAHIYKVIIKQVRQIVTMNPRNTSNNNNETTATSPTLTTTIQKSKKLTRKSTEEMPHKYQGQRTQASGTMLRVLGAARKRDVKATQNLAIIVLFFMICWIPLYTINCVKAFCPSCNVHPKLTLFCIILSHLNSAVNPILYAYHLKDFRLALKNLILRMLGIEVTQPLNTLYRYSMASQRRLQPLEITARHLHSRIYIDSPIWLRQQQQQLQLQLDEQKKQQQQQQQQQRQQQAENDENGEGGREEKSNNIGLIKPCLNNIHQNVVAAVVAPLMEAAKSGKEKNGECLVRDADMDINMDINMDTRKISGDGITEHSYDNKSYTPSVDDLGFEWPKIQMEYSFSDYEIAYHRTSPYKCDNNNECNKTVYYATPPLIKNRKRLIMHHRRHTWSQSTSSSEECLNDSQLYIIAKNQDQKIEKLTSLAFMGHKPKFKKRLHRKATKNIPESYTNHIGSQESPKMVNEQSSLQSVATFEKSDHKNCVKINAEINCNFNYYTLLQQRSSRSHEKFSPFKSGSNLSQLIVTTKKHSSLFQLFHAEPQITKQVKTKNNKVQQYQQQQEKQQQQLTNDNNLNNKNIKTVNDCNSHEISCSLLIDTAPFISNDSLVCKSSYQHSHLSTVNS